MEKYIFEIPIYRIPAKKYETILKKERKSFEKNCENQFKNTLSENRNPKSIKKHLERMRKELVFEDRHWFPWDYNEIIGWIRIFTFENQIRGEYFWVKAKSLVRKPIRKRFFWEGKAFELSINKEDSSKDIFKKIIGEIKKLKKQKPFNGRYVYLEVLKNIGQFLDWKNLMKNKYDK
jgi:hypothetical protein